MFVICVLFLFDVTCVNNLQFVCVVFNCKLTPTVGRFLNADIFIQAPANSQSSNSYSYVLQWSTFPVEILSNIFLFNIRLVWRYITKCKAQLLMV
ncbi:hypothetical protein DS2_06661 [Catenovulum agarivorans DS-2]|uniref:Uncharacterized protein n=1 Tax=Catenovulum agarivorans DS-2 TaxID=1328313 RepID=W7QFP1_9ALTE|nr:hypothetical protein DS2_06661 [Catenovulum agarivorans DS-2]